MSNRSSPVEEGMRYLEVDRPRIGEVVIIKSGPTEVFPGGYLDIAKYIGLSKFRSVDYDKKEVEHDAVVEWSYLPKGAL